MDLAKQIKKYRNELSITQEDLADRIYVSRQTISNWENDKNYPDVKSLLLLSSTFNVSLDQLIKGDITMIKETVEKAKIDDFKKESTVFAILLICCWVLPVPLFLWQRFIGFALLVALFAITFYMAYRVEKKKKQWDMQTYKEILAFTEGKHLSTEEKSIERGIRPYQKILLGLGSALITASIAAISLYFFN